jgi:PAS domain-containing protein
MAAVTETDSLRRSEESNIAAAPAPEADVLARVLDAAGHGLFTLDVASAVLRPNLAFCRLHGLPPRDAFPVATVEALAFPEDGAALSGSADPGDALYRIRRAGPCDGSASCAT